MKTKMLSLLAAAAMFSGVAVANAAEPVVLTGAQMDGVTAGTDRNHSSNLEIKVVYVHEIGAGGYAYGDGSIASAADSHSAFAVSSGSCNCTAESDTVSSAGATGVFYGTLKISGGGHR